MVLSFVGACGAGWTVDALVARGWVDAPLRWAGAVALGSGLLIAMAFELHGAWPLRAAVADARRWTSHESLTEPPDDRIATDPLHTAGLL
jgi:hypothetical protein